MDSPLFMGNPSTAESNGAVGLRAHSKQPCFLLPPCPQIVVVLQYVTMQALAHKDTHHDRYAQYNEPFDGIGQ